MYYDISFNPKAIRKLNNKTKLSYKKVGPVLGIDKQHFLEKDNWYLIDGAMQYFKNRQDSRIIGELLSDEILRMHGFVPATYELANLNDNFGLLSPNIHKEGYRYESVATLHKLFPEFRYTYNHSRNITLKGIIDFIGDNVPNGEELKTQIIRKYVVDWFTNQLDDNIRNMVFEQNLEGEIHLAKIIDSESSFGATKQGINSEMSNIWVPAIPYEDVNFRTGPYKTNDGGDINILGLLIDYPEVVIPLLGEFTDTNYDRVINKYKKSNTSGIYIPEPGVDFIKSFVESRQEESHKISTL